MRTIERKEHGPAFSHHVVSPQSSSPLLAATAKPVFDVAMPKSPTPAEVDAYVARAHELRSEAMAEGLRAVGRAFARLFARRPKADATAEAEAEAARNALSGLRASAEILRDEPDVSPARRRRLVEIILAEEARLEAMLARFAARSDGSERA
ncbi:MAG: hypothetical protein AAF322_16290 [Pseudomonadota bacterium]